MTILITGVNESLQVVLDAAPATNQLPCSASYADQLGSGGDFTANTNGTTAVTLVAAPAAGVSRVINGINIPNADTATRIVTVNKVISGTPYRLCRVSLLPGYQLGYGGGRWYVVDTNGAIQGVGATGAAGNTVLTTSGAPSSGTGNNGDFAYDPTASKMYGPKAAGVWPAGVSLIGPTGPPGTSLNRPSATLTPSAGVATINVTTGAEIYILTLAANVTSWVFNNLPSAGTIAEIRIKVIQASGGTQYTCVSPATAGNTAGGAWVNSSAASAIESIGLAIDSSGTVAVFPSGVYA